MTLSFAAVLAGFLLAFALVCVRSLHIFQLNGYKHHVQKRWYFDNLFSWLARTVWSLAGIALYLWRGERMFYWIAAVFVLTALVNIPWKKAKKPLVFTARVKRLCVTLLVFYALSVLFALSAPNAEPFFTMVYSVALPIAPYVVLLADTVNSPMEKAINRRYINEAKKILADCPNLRVIGVTGSYGKTSMKFFLAKLLSARYNVLATPESYNTTLGVVRTVRESLHATHEVFICEMGARKMGDIKEICDIVRPQYGIVTSIGEAHLESFGTLDNTLKTKLELVDSLQRGGTAFLNMDNDLLRGAKIERKKIGYGLEHGDYRAENIRVGPRGSEFDVLFPGGGRVHFTTRLIGRHNVLNVTGAIAAAHVLGVSPEQLAAQVRRLEPVPHRLQLLGAGSRLVIDDAYNSNPAGAAAALETLSQFDGVKILVTPGMVELGNLQRQCNREFGLQAARVCDYVALVGRTNSPAIAEGLDAAGYPKEKYGLFDTLQQAVAAADAVDTGGKVRIILLENDLPDNY